MTITIDVAFDIAIDIDIDIDIANDGAISDPVDDKPQGLKELANHNQLIAKALFKRQKKIDKNKG